MTDNDTMTLIVKDKLNEKLNPRKGRARIGGTISMPAITSITVGEDTKVDSLCALASAILEKEKNILPYEVTIIFETAKGRCGSIELRDYSLGVVTQVELVDKIPTEEEQEEAALIDVVMRAVAAKPNIATHDEHGTSYVVNTRVSPATLRRIAVVRETLGLGYVIAADVLNDLISVGLPILEFRAKLANKGK